MTSPAAKTIDTLGDLALIQKEIGQSLRRAYAPVVLEPLPEDMTALLIRLSSPPEESNAADLLFVTAA